jgi:hypothetical protein
VLAVDPRLDADGHPLLVEGADAVEALGVDHH